MLDKNKDISIALSLKPNLVQVNLSIKFDDIKYLKIAPYTLIPHKKITQNKTKIILHFPRRRNKHILKSHQIKIQ